MAQWVILTRKSSLSFSTDRSPCPRFGQLTVAGVEQHHRLGGYLRDHYGSLLGSTYSPSEVVVRSTDFDRTLMSAQSNLVGLYPVSNISSDRVPIQPIPIHTESANMDFVRFPPIEHTSLTIPFSFSCSVKIVVHDTIKSKWKSTRATTSRK